MGRVAVLLGAGASMDAGVPGVYDLARRLLDESLFESTAVLRFVVGQLQGDAGARGLDPESGLDVERVMTALQLLAQRQDLEVSPFVHAWHPRVRSLDARRPEVDSIAVSQLARAIRDSHDFMVERLISDVVRSLASGGEIPGSAFAQAAVDVSGALVSILSKVNDTSYLRPLLELADPGSWLCVGTLNYDLTFELMAEAAGVTCSTGVVDRRPSGEWVWPTAGVRLLKLHGSIDWRERQHRASGEPLEELRIAIDSTPGGQPPAIVFGGRNKLRPNGPYLSLLAEYEAMLAEATCLLVVGYSFRDDHVNEVIRRWANGDGQRKIVVLDPGFRGEHGDPPFAAELRNGLADFTRVTQGEKVWTSGPPARLLVHRAGAAEGLPSAVRRAKDHAAEWLPGEGSWTSSHGEA